MLYTAQYRYSGQDRLDITVKGNCPAGKLYAPTWAMVRGLKEHKNLPQDWYESIYYELLIDRWKESQANRDEMMRLVEMVKTRDITVVCFCPAGQFCHRLLLVKFLQHNWGTKYGGERDV